MRPYVLPSWKRNRWQLVIPLAHLADALVGILTLGNVDLGWAGLAYYRQLKLTINRQRAKSEASK